MRPEAAPHPQHFRGRQHAATILVVVLLAVVGFQVFPRHEVMVLSNGSAVRISATFNPRNEGLAAAAVKLGPGDRVLYGTGGRHASVAVQRARDIEVQVDGKIVDVHTQATTIGGVLAEVGITLQPADRVMLNGQATTEHGPLTGPSLVYAGNAVPFQATGNAGSIDGQITIVRARPITVMIDTKEVDTMSAAATVDDLLNEMGITVREVDLVQPAPATALTAGMVVRLAPAKTVNLKLDGKDQTLYTQAQTVADILRILNVDPGPDEILSLPRSTPVTTGMELVVGLNRTFTEQVQEPVAPDTVYDTDSTLAAGTIKVIPGVPGVRVITYSVTTKNGVETSRTVVSTEVTQAPVAAHQVTGTKPAPPKPTLNAPDYTGTYVRKITMRATWYNATQGGKARTDPGYGITATGVRLDYGICAVDPNVIPLGTWVYVPLYGKCLAADTGGAIKGNAIDLGFPESAGNQPWATQTLDVYVLD